MSKRSGLSRGLEEILGDYGKEIISNTKEKASDERLQDISCTEIQAGQYQPRRKFKEENINELAASVAEYGVLQPLVIRPVKAENPAIKYEIIAGERRFRAAKQCGLAQVPCIIKNYNDEQAIAISLIENLQRADLNPLEIAEGFQKLVDKFNLSHEQIGKLLGISRSNVSNTLRLLKLSAAVKEALEEEKIEKGHARAIAALQENQQLLLLNEIIAKNLTVQQTEAKVRQLNTFNSLAADKFKPKKSPDIVNLEDKVSDFLGYSVAINHQHNGAGKIVLKYKNLDELDAILEKWGYK
ncbi:MAG: ParB/RepB/Spo0J family partition protein [Cardiobacteriaceae bacterium]|nr:ParB/RepB/Spo0J family partition protein [Cardiobacteriaceae bacterium]